MGIAFVLVGFIITVIGLVFLNRRPGQSSKAQAIMVIGLVAILKGLIHLLFKAGRRY